jgi:NADPH:quinone reductase-like Zn-dependent oxidoreductase
MRAVQFTEFGGPEVLRLVEVEAPHPGPGEIRITVHAAGVNAVDWKVRAGYMQEVMPVSLPAGTGMDAAGVVDEIGPGIGDVSIGDAVFGSGSATFAEHAVLTAWAPKPQSVSFVEAAGFPTPVETALRILDQVRIQTRQTLLISGAAGGVGSAAVQIACDQGIAVIGTASAGNQDYLRSLGATPTIYGPGLASRVRTLAPGGIDAALDVAGSGVIPDLIELTGDPAKVVSIADMNAWNYGAQFSTKPENVDKALVEAARLATTGRLSLRVQDTYTLSQTAEAHSVSAAGHVAGRLIVTVS